jgi:hypothetical protein
MLIGIVVSLPIMPLLSRADGCASMGLAVEHDYDTFPSSSAPQMSTQLQSGIFEILVIKCYHLQLDLLDTLPLISASCCLFS